MMKPAKFQRFTYPLVLEQIPAVLLGRFFDHFKNDLLARKCCLPSTPPGTEAYCNRWAALLRSPETLPDSLVHAMEELAEQAAPENWPRLEAAVSHARVAHADINTNSSRESLALQLWLWEQKLSEGELRVESGAALVASDSPPIDVAQISNSAVSPSDAAARAPVAETPLNSQLTSLSTNANTGMKSIGKISRLPREIREQLNRRLQNEEEAKPLLEWLNGLPEVQAVLTAEFEGRPITRQNLYDWKQYGFRNWQMRQSSLEFVRTLDEDAGTINPAGPQSFAGALTEKLAQWIALRYAAAAQALSVTDEDPQTELRRLREFCRDIVALRRGDLGAGRLSLEHARLAAEQVKSEAELEERFWEWTKRPEVQARLHPRRDPDKIRREVVRMVDRELLGIRHSDEEPTEPIQDPAIMI